MVWPLKYGAEFRSGAIALWWASAGRRVFKDVAADLNVDPETLRTWVRDTDAPSAAVSRGVECPGVATVTGIRSLNQPRVGR
ncbi:transposase [Streptomyces sp. NPDC058394]|uniref:transposase n=1 Tax=Streptomyces sp. NPDC058394 TaxID=3346477 RepID=UPI0036683A5B